MLQDFIKFLPIAEKIIPGRTSIDVIKNIAVCKGYMMATDLEMTAIMKIDDKKDFLVPMSIIKTVLKSRPVRFDIDLSEKNRIKITYDDKAVSFPANDVNDCPMFPMQKFHYIGTWDKACIELLHSQLPYCSMDELRPALCGVYVSQNGSFTSCATDGHVLRLIRNIDIGNNKVFEGIIPRNVLKLLPRIVKTKVQVSVSTEYYRFIIDNGIEIFSRKIEETYPQYQQVLPKEYQGIIAIDKKRFIKLADAAKAFAEKSQKSIVHINNDSIIMQVENHDSDTTWESKMPIDVLSNKKMDLGMNIGYLEKVLHGIESDRALWKYNDSDSATLIVEEDKENVVNLLMPVRINNGGDHDH